MKKIVIAMAMLFFMCACAIAGDKKEEMFEVKITVVYNSVPAAEATKIQERVLSTFKNTCKTLVETKKVDTDTWVTLDTGTNVITRDQLIQWGITADGGARAIEVK